MARLDWTIGAGVPKYLELHARAVVKRITRVSPLLHDVRLVLVGAYQYPSGNDFVCGEFQVPFPGSSTPVLYVCVFSSGQRLAHVTDTICHEWGHYEQYRDKRPIDEGADIERRTKRLLEAVK